MSNYLKKIFDLLGVDEERLNPPSEWIQPENPIILTGIFSNSYINADMIKALLSIKGTMFDIFAGNGYLKSILGDKLFATSLDGNPENGVLPMDAVRMVEFILKTKGPVTIIYMNPPPQNSAPYKSLKMILEAVRNDRTDIRVVFIQEK